MSAIHTRSDVAANEVKCGSTLQERDAFTHEWIKSVFLPGLWHQTFKDKLEFVRSILYQPEVVNQAEATIMRLQLDYVFESGLTLLPFLLDAIEHSRKSRFREKLPNYELSEFVKMKPRQQYLYEMVLANIRRNGYTRFEQFAGHDLWNRELGLSPPAEPAPVPREHSPTITALTFVVSVRCRVERIRGYGGLLECAIKAADEIAFLAWTEQVILHMFDQPTLTHEAKITLVNQSCLKFAHVPLLSTVIYDDHLSLPICHAFFRYADINLVLRGQRSCTPLYSSIRLGRADLLIEMLLAQTNFLARDFTNREAACTSTTSVAKSTSSPLSYVRTLVSVYPHSSTNIMKRIIERLHQWQEEQRTQIAADANFQPSDAVLRDWLHQQLSELPQQLWSEAMCQLLVDTPYAQLTDDDRSRVIDSWVKQLNEAPHLVHLLLDAASSSRCLLFASIDLFLAPPFRPHIQQILDLLKDSNDSFVHHLLVFNDWFSVLRIALAIKLKTISSGPTTIEQREQIAIIFKFMKIGFNHINHCLQVCDDPTFIQNQDYLLQLKLLYGYERLVHELREELLKRSETITLELPEKVCGLISTIARCPIDVFKSMWMGHLSTLSFVRSNELRCYYQLLHCLVDSVWSLHSNRTPIALQRFQSWLSDPFFYTSDLFQPFQLFPLTSTKRFNGLTMIERMTRPTPQEVDVKPTVDPFLEFVRRLEFDWCTIHISNIRNNLDQFLIPDLSNMVIHYIQTSTLVGHTQTTTTSISDSTTPSSSASYTTSAVLDTLQS